MPPELYYNGNSVDAERTILSDFARIEGTVFLFFLPGLCLGYLRRRIGVTYHLEIS